MELIIEGDKKMKKRFLFLGWMVLLLFLTTGCLGRDDLAGANIKTSIYPIEYLVSRLYGYNSKISSIYPNDAKVDEYVFTDKQLNDFAKSSSLFVYNGLSTEKEVAKSLLDKNKKIQILDVSYGLKTIYGMEELWLDPNNYLMLANTLKNDLEELSANKYTIQAIEDNYRTLEEELATLDASMRNIAKRAKKENKESIVIAYDSYMFLKDYGFDVINISSENNITNTIKGKFKDKVYKYILVNDLKNVPDAIQDLVDNYDAQLVLFDTMETLSDSQRTNNDTYLTIMNSFLANLLKIVTE